MTYAYWRKRERRITPAGIPTGFKKDKLRDTPNMLGNKEKANANEDL
jgi:hypothetical protein